MDYNKLKDIIKESVNEAFMENGLANMMPLNEMAVRRSDYMQYCMSQSPTVYKHIGKICVYENDERMSHYVKHWEDEIAAQIYDLGRIDVTKDNKDCKIKKKAFIQGFIEGRLGQDLSEYDEKMISYIEDGLYDEGMSQEQIKKLNVPAIASSNKERIHSYLYSFVDLLSIKDLTLLKTECNNAAHNF